MCTYFDQIMNSRSFWGPPDDMIWLDMIVHIQILFERDKCDKKKKTILGLNLKVLFWYNCFSKKIVIGFGPQKKLQIAQCAMKSPISKKIYTRME